MGPGGPQQVLEGVAGGQGALDDGEKDKDKDFRGLLGDKVHWVIIINIILILIIILIAERQGAFDDDEQDTIIAHLSPNSPNDNDYSS